MYRYWRLTSVALITVGLTACMVGPNFHSPTPPKTTTLTQTPLPKKTVRIPKAGKAGQAQYFDQQQIVMADWWTLFHSKELNNLILQGIANSPNLAAAQHTLIEARENLNVQIGNLLFPQANLNLSMARDKTTGLLFGSTSSPSTIFTVYNTSTSVSYPLDIFGGNRRQIEASAAQVDYARYELLASYITLTANIVTTSIATSSLEAQIQAVKSLVRDQTNMLVIIQKQLRLGGASENNVLSQQTELANTLALLPPLKSALAQSQSQLAVLIGAFPSQNTAPIISLDSLVLPTHLPLSLPSAIVKQRPDIQAAEASLHQASALIGVATANLLPQISIDGSFGWVASSPNQLFKPASEIWGIGGQLLQPLFHGGALLAARRGAIAAFNVSYDQYRQTVLQSFKNISDVLYALDNDAETFKAYKLAEVSARQTYLITSKQYKLGGASYLNLLTAESQYEQARINSIKAQAARYSDTAALFQALGGGWWNQQTSSPQKHNSKRC